MNPDDASLFVVGFSVYLTEGLGRSCPEYKTVAKMEQVKHTPPPGEKPASCASHSYIIQ